MYAIIATICWSFENNFTKALSSRNAVDVTIIKGLGVGISSLIISFLMNESWHGVYSLLLGFVAYGISIVFYIMAQRGIGAAKTSAYYSIAPFVSVFPSAVFLGEKLTIGFVIALILMVLGSILVTKDALN